MLRMPAVPGRITTLILTVISAIVVVSHAFAQPPTAGERSKQIKIKIGSKNFIATRTMLRRVRSEPWCP